MIKDVLNKIITNIKDERVNRDSRTRIEPRVSSRCVAFDSKRVLPLQTEQSTGADTHSPWQKAILLETLFPGSSTCLLSLPLPLPFLYSPFSPFPPPLPLLPTSLHSTQRLSSSLFSSFLILLAFPSFLFPYSRLSSVRVLRQLFHILFRSSPLPMLRAAHHQSELSLTFLQDFFVCNNAVFRILLKDLYYYTAKIIRKIYQFYLLTVL